MERKLTGKTRHRSNWLGKLILQVEVEWSDECPYSGPRNTGKVWRDASTQDIAELLSVEPRKSGGE